MLPEIRNNFDDNLARVKNLVDVYATKISGAGKGRRPVMSTDVLRAATVLLHATLEEFLRGISRWKLPKSGEEALDRIPLAGLDSDAKFKLGKLSSHRGKSVDDLIAESVNLYLQRSNYNNTSEISSLLTSIDIDCKKVEHLYPTISVFLDRRHQIVHRADRDENQGSGHHRATSIAVKTVNKWIVSVVQFAGIVCNELDEPDPGE